MKKNLVRKCMLFVFAAGLVLSNGEAQAQVAPPSADIVLGQPNMTSCEDNTATDTRAMNWTSVTTCGSKMIVADFNNNRVLIYNTFPTSNHEEADVVVGQQNMSSTAANQGGSVAANTLNGPRGVHCDGTKLYVADQKNHRVLIYNTVPTANNASANVVVGQQVMEEGSVNAGAGETTAATLNYPYSVTVANSKLIVADNSNHRVLVYDPIPTTDGAMADFVFGQLSMSGNLANFGSGSLVDVGEKKLSSPTSVSTDGTKIFIADSGNNRVLILNSVPTGDGQSAANVVGQQDFNTGLANQGPGIGIGEETLSGPTGAMSDGTSLYVADYGNSRVLKYNTVPASPNAVANKVFGQANFTSGSRNAGGACSASTLADPFIAYPTSDGKLLVSDNFNNRILIFDFVPALSEAGAIGTCGSSRPAYAFNSTKSGTITYGGSCNSDTTTAVSGTNLIELDALPNGTYSDCTITVTNDGYSSEPLSITPFTVSMTLLTPVASPPGGAYVTSPLAITLYTPGTDFFLYTLDGSTPASGSSNTIQNHNGEAIYIGSNTTLKAFATKDFTNSSLMTETYTFVSSSPIYRFWSGAKQGHFYTQSAAERDHIINNDPSWEYEGPAFSSYPTSASGITEVYRFWSDQKQHHFYTVSAAEKASIEANDPSWEYEGVAYYTYATEQAGTTPVYRFWSDAKQGHFYTTSAAEKASIEANDPSWAYEGIAWYVPTT